MKQRSPRSKWLLMDRGIKISRPSIDFIMPLMNDVLWDEAVSRAARTGESVAHCAVEVLAETVGILVAKVESLQRDNADLSRLVNGVTKAPPWTFVSRRGRGDR
jgi:hypothetical protein